jgi:SagB-type dehydrogenase family enzyme
MDNKGEIPRIHIIITTLVLLLATEILSLIHFCEIKDEREDVSVETKEYKLSAPAKKGDMSLEEAIANRRSVRTYTDGSIGEKDLSQLLWAAQGITDEARGLRTAPSAGAIYPLEIYVAAAMVDGIDPGLYKYDPSNHSLILRKDGDIREDICNASLRQGSIKNAAAVIVYSAVIKRTVSRYGDKAPKYVYIEAGHSAQNVYLQAEALDLGTVAIGAFNDKGVKEVLGLPDEEDPVYLMPVGKK